MITITHATRFTFTGQSVQVVIEQTNEGISFVVNNNEFDGRTWKPVFNGNLKADEVIELHKGINSFIEKTNLEKPF